MARCEASSVSLGRLREWDSSVDNEPFLWYQSPMNFKKSVFSLGVVFVVGLAFLHSRAVSADLVDLSEAQWGEFEGWVAQINPDLFHGSGPAEVTSEVRVVERRKLLRGLSIELPFQTLKQTFETYGILQLRPSRSHQLLVGCGNHPLERVEESGDSVDAADHLLPPAQRHQHLAWDTVDPNPLQNPTFIAFFGRENFTRFLEEQGAHYELVQPEGCRIILGLDLLASKVSESLKETSQQLARVLTPQGRYKTYRTDLLLVGPEFAEDQDLFEISLNVVVLPVDLTEFRAQLAVVLREGLTPLGELEHFDVPSFYAAVNALPEMQRLRLLVIEQLNQGGARYGFENVQMPENFQDLTVSGFSKEKLEMLWQQCKQGVSFDLEFFTGFLFSYDVVSFQVRRE